MAEEELERSIVRTKYEMGAGKCLLLEKADQRWIIRALPELALDRLMNGYEALVGHFPCADTRVSMSVVSTHSRAPVGQPSTEGGMPARRRRVLMAATD
jgi:hypothetical protein